MVDSKAVDAVRSAVTALNDGDVDGYLGHFDPLAQRWVAGVARPFTLPEISDNLRQLQAAFEGLRLHEDLLFGHERFVCARWRMQGIHVNDYLGIAPAKQSIDVETCEIYELGCDLVISTWTYGDIGQLFRQITAETNVR